MADITKIIGSRLGIIILTFIVLIATAVILHFASKIFSKKKAPKIKKKKGKARKNKIKEKNLTFFQKIGLIFQGSGNGKKKRKKKREEVKKEEKFDVYALVKLKNLDEVDFDTINYLTREFLETRYKMKQDLDYADISGYFEEVELQRGAEFARKMLEIQSQDEKQKQKSIQLVLTMLNRFIVEDKEEPGKGRRIRWSVFKDSIRKYLPSFIKSKNDESLEDDGSLFDRREPEDETKPIPSVNPEVSEEETIKPTKIHPTFEKIGKTGSLEKAINSRTEYEKARKKKRL